MHFRKNDTREVASGRHLKSEAYRGNPQEDQRVTCDGRLPNLYLRQVSDKPNGTSHRRWALMQHRKAGLIQQRPGWLDAR